MSFTTVESSNIAPLKVEHASTVRMSKRKKHQINTSASVKKTLKRRRLKNHSSGEEQDLDYGNQICTTVGNLNSQLLADYFAQKVKKQGGDLSFNDLEESYLPGTSKTF